jgi:hypothetical protein
MLRVLVVLSLLSLGPAPIADDAEDLFEAARTGNAAGVKALIAKGVDVNAKWRYDTTALMMAARRGHTDVVKLLLDSGANPNVKDSFYGMTPLSSAAGEGRIEIVRMLLDKGAQGIDGVLQAGVAQNKIDLVKLALAKGGIKPETLSTALGNAERNNRTEIAEALRAAGAVPPPKADFQVDPETLRRYAGTYRDPRESEFVVEVKDGKLFAGPVGQSLQLGAFDAVTFQPVQMAGIRIVFQVEGTKVTGFTLKQGESLMQFKRVEGK